MWQVYAVPIQHYEQIGVHAHHWIAFRHARKCGSSPPLVAYNHDRWQDLQMTMIYCNHLYFVRICIIFTFIIV